MNKPNPSPGALRALIRGDGCTSAPELWYHECCNEHDRAYTTHTDAAGQPITRAQADTAFFACMRKARRTLPITGLLIPFAYWLAVRAFGRKFWNKAPPTPQQQPERIDP